MAELNRKQKKGTIEISKLNRTAPALGAVWPELESTDQLSKLAWGPSF